jgi:N-acetylneuraminic acid mutarotase
MEREIIPIYLCWQYLSHPSPIVYENKYEMHDPNQNKWTTLKTMPSERSGIAAAFIVDGSNIYVFGGEEPSMTLNNNEKYDIQYVDI